MELKQNDMDYLIDMVRKGELTADQANVQKVRMKRVEVVRGRMMAQVRKALNDAVKRGELGHLKKDGHKPEVYYHPTFEYMAKEERSKHALSVARALAGVMARGVSIDFPGSLDAGIIEIVD